MDTFSIYVSIVQFLLGLLAVGLSVAIWLAIIMAAVYVLHFLFSLPMRRSERARLFLDVIENAIRSKQSIESTILSLAASRDRTLGTRFHLLAAYLEMGLKLGQALERVTRFLPPQISAMFKAGEKLGDLRLVLPACREIIRDRPAGVRSAFHYMLLTLIIFSPGAIYVTFVISRLVIPRFKDIATSMGAPTGRLAHFVLYQGYWLIDFEIIFFLLLGVMTVIYIGGPRFVRWFQFQSVPLVDWLAWQVPWKQKRLQRTFSAMLAVLLDSGVAEEEAVRLAGDSTANDVCRHKAQEIIASLKRGVKLDDAVRAFDTHGEFHWRLTNAARTSSGFLRALRGWHEALDAKAFQQEEATAHILTSGLVIINGLVVAMIAVAMFGVLTGILNGVTTP